MAIYLYYKLRLRKERDDMEKQEFARAFEEMMNKYNENRQRWIAEKGNDRGFDEWFTAQI